MTSVHPATIRWWEQRETCRRCVHHTHMGHTARDGSLGERCAAVRLVDMVNVPGYETHPDMKRPPKGVRPYQSTRHPKLQVFAYCIDARLDGAPCGPTAQLFKEKT